jgi:hypothetical protein
MKRLFLLWLLGGLLTPIVTMAQSDFDGTWKIDLNKVVMPNDREILILQNRNYQRKTCVPIVSLKADGEDHSVTGNPYLDAISIKVLDDRSIERSEKRNGKIVATSKMTFSGDANTATLEFTESSGTNADPVIGKASITRVAKSKRPTGSHAISGSWRISKMENLSDNALVFTFKVEGDVLNMTSPTGRSYTAKLDGTEAPYKGHLVVNAVSIMRLSKDTFMETDKHDGEAIRVKRVMVAPDNDKTMNIIVTDNLRKTFVLFVADKQ